MNDLIRLMFDDGASRAPVRETYSFTFWFKDKLWTMYELTQEECARGEESNWSFYAPGVAVKDPQNIDNFKADAEKTAERLWGPFTRPGRPHAAYSKYRDIVFVRFVEVSL